MGSGKYKVVWERRGAVDQVGPTYANATEAWQALEQLRKYYPLRDGEGHYSVWPAYQRHI
jgi:hypothetical protein